MWEAYVIQMLLVMFLYSYVTLNISLYILLLSSPIKEEGEVRFFIAPEFNGSRIRLSQWNERREGKGQYLSFLQWNCDLKSGMSKG